MRRPALSIAVVLATSAVTFAGITTTGDVTGSGPINGSTNPLSLAQIIVGNTGTGTMTVDANSDVVLNAGGVDPYIPRLFVGKSAGSVGTLNLSGTGTTFSVTGPAKIGDYGTGVVNLSNNARMDVTGSTAGVYLNHNSTNQQSRLVVNSGAIFNTTSFFSVWAGAGANTKEITVDGGTLTTDRLSLGYGGASGQSTDLVFNSGNLNPGVFTIAAHTKSTVDMSGGTLNASFLYPGYQGHGIFNMTGGTVTAGAFNTASLALGNAEVTIGSGASINTQGAHFGQSGNSVATIQGSFISNGSISIGGGTNKSSSVAVYPSATFRTNSQIVVGGYNASQAGVLSLVGNATVQSSSQFRIQAGGLVESVDIGNSVSTIKVTSNSVQIDGTLKAREKSTLRLDTTQNSQVGPNGTIQIDLLGAAGQGKIRLVRGLRLDGTLIISQPTTTTNFAFPMYTAYTLIEGESGSAPIINTFDRILTKRDIFQGTHHVDANTALAVTYTSTKVIVQRAKYGDANLDNRINFDDLLILAQRYGTAGTWAQGDFNADGQVNFDDLLTLAQRYTSSGIDGEDAFAASFASDWALAQSLVPEPATLASLLVPTLMLGRRRARR